MTRRMNVNSPILGGGPSSLGPAYRARLRQIEREITERGAPQDRIVLDPGAEFARQRREMTDEERRAESDASYAEWDRKMTEQRAAEEAERQQVRADRLKDHLRSIFMAQPGATKELFEEVYPELHRRWLVDVASGKFVPPEGLGDPVQEGVARILRVRRGPL